MAKKLIKAQMGLFLKKAIKTASKIEAPVFKNKKIINEVIPKATEARSVNSLIKGKESMVNANNPYKTIKKPRPMTKAEIQQKQIDDSYKQQGGPMDGDKSRPSITARPKQTPKPKKDALNPNSNRVVPRNFVAPGKPAAPGSAAYPLEHFKPFKPTVAKKGGAVKTKKK